jgi:hypothetical protein
MRREGRDYLAGALALYLSVLPWAMPGFSIARCHDALMNPRVGRVPGDRPPFSRLVLFSPGFAWRELGHVARSI